MAGNQTFSDDDFTPDSSSLYWDIDSYNGNVRWIANNSEWKRIKDQFADGHSLFGSGGITPTDVIQGDLGNCWFLSAIGSLAEWPGKIEQLFLNTEDDLNSQGIYAVNLYTLGVPHTIVVDDWLPLFQGWDGGYTTMFTEISKDSSLWAPIIEKAFSKYHGNYQHIEAGWPEVAATTLTGGPGNTWWHSQISMEDLWAKMLEHENSNDVI